jgi:O-antigen ligase
MKLLSSRRWLAPLLLLAFAGVAVTYVNLVFSSASRWAVLALVLWLTLMDRSCRALLRTRVMQASLIFAVWAMATYLWSELPALSMMKASALVFVMLAGAGSGYLWVRHHPLDAALDCLAPLSFMVLAAALFGIEAVSDPNPAGNVTMYKGMTSNSNMFGMLCAMSFPFAAWKYSQGRGTRWRYVWGAMALFLAAFTFLSNSRAAIGVVILSWLGLFGAPGLRRILPAAVVASMAMALFVLTMPEMARDLQYRYVYKGHPEERVTRSRSDVWAISYEQALKGGWFGGGYGVTIGSSVPFAGGLSSAGYGREKGNSQLGIMEETGVVGLLIYLAATASLFTAIWKARIRCRDRRLRSLLGLLLGLLAGLTFQSVFEGWYNAPGSPECMYYWIISGIAIGLSEWRLPHASSVDHSRRTGFRNPPDVGDALRSLGAQEAP